MKSFKQVEQEYISDLFKIFNGNVKSMTKPSGLSRATLYRKINDLGLRPRKEEFIHKKVYSGR